MKLYKLKHLPTGLFFTPSKGSGNLSSKGKIYIDRIPDLKWVESIRIVFYPNPTSKSQKNKKLLEFFKLMPINGKLTNVLKLIQKIGK